MEITHLACAAERQRILHVSGEHGSDEIAGKVKLNLKSTTSMENAETSPSVIANVGAEADY